jgi:hypothetical protein
MLIAKYSSSAHELMLQFLVGHANGSLRVRREACDVLLDRPAVQPSLDPQGAGESSAAERQGEALGRGVQVRSPARKPAPRVRDDREAGSGFGGDDSKQLVPGGALSAPQAGADGFC